MMASEAREQKVTEAERLAFIADELNAIEQSLILGWLTLNPEVGTLTRNGETVYYRWPAGGE